LHRTSISYHLLWIFRLSFGFHCSHSIISASNRELKPNSNLYNVSLSIEIASIECTNSFKTKECHIFLISHVITFCCCFLIWVWKRKCKCYSPKNSLSGSEKCKRSQLKECLNWELQKSRTILLPLVTLKKIGQSVIRTFWRFFLLPCIRALFCLAILHVWLIVDTLGLKMGWGGGGGPRGYPLFAFYCVFINKSFSKFSCESSPNMCIYLYVQCWWHVKFDPLSVREGILSRPISVSGKLLLFFYLLLVFYLNGKIRLGLSFSIRFSYVI